MTLLFLGCSMGSLCTWPSDPTGDQKNPVKAEPEDTCASCFSFSHNKIPWSFFSEINSLLKILFHVYLCPNLLCLFEHWGFNFFWKHLLERQIYRNKDKQISHLLVYSQMPLTGRVDQIEARVRKLHPYSIWGTVTQPLGPSSTVSRLQINRELNWNWT